jgi:serine protease Do
MSIIDELQAGAGQVATKVGAATVRIGRDGGRGAGVVTASRSVVTNAHNLRGPHVTVTFADGRSLTGEVKGVDGDGDLAVIAVDTADIEPVGWSERAAELGTPVWAVSLPSTGGVRVTFGTVSAVDRAFHGPHGRRIAGSIEHTAPLARGSSGGPLVDAEGRLVGLNTHRLGEGFYLALPTDADLRRRLDDLTKGQAPERRRLGVALAPVHVSRRLRAAVGLPERDGLLVRAVEDGSPADRAGIRQGDLIVAAGERSITTGDDLFTALDESDASVSLTVVRGAEDVTIAVTFVTPPSA